MEAAAEGSWKVGRDSRFVPESALDPPSCNLRLAVRSRTLSRWERTETCQRPRRRRLPRPRPPPPAAGSAAGGPTR